MADQASAGLPVSGELATLPPERVWQALRRGLMGARPRRFIEVLRACGACAAVLPEVERLFGVPQPERYHPEIDTGEQGVAGVEATVWNGFFFPKGTPKPIVDKMHQAIETVIARPDIRKKMEDLGLEILPTEQRTPAYFAKFLKGDIERWSKVIKAAGISMD